VAHPVFKTGRARQPRAWKVRFLRRFVSLLTDAGERGFIARLRRKRLVGGSGSVLVLGTRAGPSVTSGALELDGSCLVRRRPAATGCSAAMPDGARHTAHGWWLEEAGPVDTLPTLHGDHEADVVIVGGGYAGMWTAWHLLERTPGTRIVLLEADLCGHGPSGRNGGFCETLWTALPALRQRLGDQGALQVAIASSESARAIGAWCEEQGVDAWYRRGGTVTASTSPAQDRAGQAAARAAAELGVPERVQALGPAEVAEHCRSAIFRGGIFVPDEATVHPARLALGLRRKLAERGVPLFEHSRVRRLAAHGASGVTAETEHGRVRATAAVLAMNAATRGVRPLRSRLSVTSSHIVLTEPVPDVIAQTGWTGGEAITDGRIFVHYFRTTNDDRILFGWGGGRVTYGARLHGRTEVDPQVVDETHEHLLRVFPSLRGRRIEHAWGGPIDVSPSHLPQIGTLPGTAVHYAFGFTGNGVGPSHLAGRELAGLALGAPDGLPLVGADAVRVPPEPLAWLGGMVVRAANLRKERLEEDDGRPDPLTRAIAAAPRALGIHLGR
jgi:glycine/D-amino acid oxidase-like deaminating enzyme